VYATAFVAETGADVTIDVVVGEGVFPSERADENRIELASHRFCRYGANIEIVAIRTKNRNEMNTT